MDKYRWVNAIIATLNDLSHAFLHASRVFPLVDLKEKLHYGA